ncbi:MAG: hypothetical protein ACO3I0_15555 [Limisphaerales bacterium]
MHQAVGRGLRLGAAVGLTAFSVLSTLAGPELKTDLDPVCGLPRLSVKSLLADNAVELQVSDDLGAPGVWETLMRLAPGTQEKVWFDPEATRIGRRFYRVAVRPPMEWPFAANFALIDQDGRRHEFLREGDAKAVVMVFTDNAHLADTWAQIRPLQERYQSGGIRFWLINPTDPRSTLAAAVRDAGVKVPVLHDAAQLVSRTWGIRSAGEVVALDRSQFEPFYAGALASRYPGVATPEVPHLEQALGEFAAGKTVTVQRVKATGDLLGLAAARVPDYRTEIAPLVQSRCVNCHRQGDIGSFPILKHADLADRAREIRDSVLSGSMPPWQADPAHGQFSNDFSLTPDEAARLVSWIDAGSPKGESGDPLAENPPQAPAAWPLGQPDKVVSIAAQTIPASGEVPYRYLMVKNPWNRDVWLRGAAVKPGNREVVHHCLVFVAKTVFDFLQVQGGLGGFFAGYVPGMDQTFYPEGTGKLLPAGAYLVFQMHYTPNGKSSTDITQLGFYEAKVRPTRELTTTAAYDTGFSIPAGVRDHEVVAETTVERHSILYEMSPHMHYRGARMRFEAFYPDGRNEVLLNVPGYEFDWQAMYRLKEPKRLPAGTRLRITGGFDNSKWNPWNPSPSSIVQFGEQTGDEMLIGYLNIAPE